MCLVLQGVDDGLGLVEEAGDLDLVLVVSSVLVVGHAGRLDTEADDHCDDLYRSQPQMEADEEVSSALVEDVASKGHGGVDGRLEENEIAHEACGDLDLAEAGREDVGSRHGGRFDDHDAEDRAFCHKVDHVHWRKACLDDRDQVPDHLAGWVGR